MHIQRERAFLLVVLLVFVGLQLFLLPQEAVINDEMVYAWNVKLIQSDWSQLLSPVVWQYHPPLFSFLASILAIFLDPLWSVRLLSMLFGVIALILTYLLGKELFSARIGVISALVLLGNIGFLVYSHYGILDVALTATCALLLLGLLRWKKTQQWDLILFSVGAALLLKRSGFLIFGMAIVGIWADRIFEWKKNPHSFSPIQAAGRGIITLALSAGVWFFQGSFDREILTYYDYSAGLLSIAWNNLPILWEFFSFEIIFFILGLLVVWKSQHRAKWIPLLGVFVFVFIFFFPYAEVRYLLPLFPFVAVLMAAGIDSIHLRFTRYNGLIQVLLIGIIVLPSLLAFTWILLHPTAGMGYSAAGEWLQQHSGTAVVYDSLEREIRYYSIIELEEHGGRIRKYPLTKEMFESQLETDETTFAVIANWPNTFGPFYPTDAYVQSLGFVEAMNVYRVVQDKNISVIRIYRKN